MKLYLLILFIFGNSLGNLVRNVRIIDHVNYIINVVTETVEEIESREWCNLKIPDAEPIEIDEIVLELHAKGNVSYNNGFVVSIQRVDLLKESVGQQVTLNTEQRAQAILKGTLRMHDVAIGYDVKATLEDGTYLYTAKYVYPLINMDFTITRVIDSENIAVTVNGNVPTRRSAATFMPSDRLSDALSTLFNPNMSAAGIIAWGTDLFQPIAREVVTSRVQFPEICYNCPT